jgi:hypothetical protein
MEPEAAAGTTKQDRWSLDGERGIVWRIGRPESEQIEPHEERIEMAGRRVWMALLCGVDTEGQIRLSREIRWHIEGSGDRENRRTLGRTYESEMAVKLTMDGEALPLGRVERVRFDGTLTVEHAAVRGVAVNRTIFPSMKEPAAFEKWTIRSRKREECRVEVSPFVAEERDESPAGTVVIETYLRDLPNTPLSAGGFLSFAMVFRARRASETTAGTSLIAEERDRKHFVSELRRSYLLDTPDRALNRAFEVSKLQATEETWRNGHAAPSFWSMLVEARGSLQARWRAGHVPSPSDSRQHTQDAVRSLFGIEVTGTDSFRCAPVLPTGWDRMALKQVPVFGDPFDLLVERNRGVCRLTVVRDGQVFFSQAGERFEVRIPRRSA